MNIKKLLTRSISGLVYIGVIVAGILTGHIGVAVLGIVLGVLATIEFEKICGDTSISTLPSLVLDILGVISLALTPLFPELWLSIWLLIYICRLICALYIKSDSPLNRIAHSFLIQLYIGLPMCLMGLLSDFIGSTYIILLVFIYIWINDTGAFLVGSMIGKHKLFPRLSPKKSWEGFWGGMILNIFISIAFYYFIPNGFGFEGTFWIYIGLAIVCSVFATWGDLIESMIKRELNIKDSGNLIPGHGGILDRIDSFLLVMPTVFLYFIFIKLIV